MVLTASTGCLSRRPFYAAWRCLQQDPKPVGRLEGSFVHASFPASEISPRVADDRRASSSEVDDRAALEKVRGPDGREHNFNHADIFNLPRNQTLEADGARLEHLMCFLQVVRLEDEFSSMDGAIQNQAQAVYDLNVARRNEVAVLTNEVFRHRRQAGDPCDLLVSECVSNSGEVANVFEASAAEQMRCLQVEHGRRAALWDEARTLAADTQDEAMEWEKLYYQCIREVSSEDLAIACGDLRAAAHRFTRYAVASSGIRCPDPNADILDWLESFGHFLTETSDLLVS